LIERALRLDKGQNIVAVVGGEGVSWSIGIKAKLGR
jgi:hypothetical protein